MLAVNLSGQGVGFSPLHVTLSLLFGVKIMTRPLRPDPVGQRKHEGGSASAPPERLREEDPMECSRVLAAAALVWSLGLGARGGEAPRCETISREQLSSTPNVLILDVRQEHQWKESRFLIPGAFREDPARVNAWASKYARGLPIVVYCDCPGEATSAQVARELVVLGLRGVSVLEGGWRGWSEAGFPVEEKPI